MARAVGARPQFLRHRQAHAGGDLLRAQKILMRRMFEALALERDDALVAGGVRSLVDGHGQMPTAQQRARIGRSRRDGRRDTGGVEAGAGAHFAGRGVVDDQHPYRPSLWVWRMKRPWNFSVEPSSTVSTIASPKSFATGVG